MKVEFLHRTHFVNKHLPIMTKILVRFSNEGNKYNFLNIKFAMTIVSSSVQIHIVTLKFHSISIFTSSLLTVCLSVCTCLADCISSMD